MSLEKALQFVPTFVLAFFRVAGLMLSAPLFGSARVPRRVKLMMAVVLTVGVIPAIKPMTAFPDSSWDLALGIGGELVFGLFMGLCLTLSFIAVTWAGQMIGQQMGMNLGEALDPQMGSQGTVIGDMYFMFLLAIFLIAGGHHAMLRGLRDSFTALPLLSVGVSRNLLDMLLGLLQSVTMLAMRLAAPLLLAAMVIDLALGFIGKTMPQINVMSSGLAIRTGLGMALLILGLALTSATIRESLFDSMNAVRAVWRGGISI